MGYNQPQHRNRLCLLPELGLCQAFPTKSGGSSGKLTHSVDWLGQLWFKMGYCTNGLTIHWFCLIKQSHRSGSLNMQR